MQWHCWWTTKVKRRLGNEFMLKKAGVLLLDCKFPFQTRRIFVREEFHSHSPSTLIAMRFIVWSVKTSSMSHPIASADIKMASSNNNRQFTRKLSSHRWEDCDFLRQILRSFISFGKENSLGENTSPVFPLRRVSTLIFSCRFRVRWKMFEIFLKRTRNIKIKRNATKTLFETLRIISGSRRSILPTKN